MSKRLTLQALATGALIAGALTLPGLAQAQSKLKFAHVWKGSEVS